MVLTPIRPGPHPSLCQRRRERHPAPRSSTVSSTHIGSVPSASADGIRTQTPTGAMRSAGAQPSRWPRYGKRGRWRPCQRRQPRPARTLALQSETARKILSPTIINQLTDVIAHNEFVGQTRLLAGIDDHWGLARARLSPNISPAPHPTQPPSTPRPPL